MEEAGFGVEHLVVGVAALVDSGELRGAVGSGVAGGDDERVGRLQARARAECRVGDAFEQRDALGGAGHADRSGCAGCLGHDVPPGPGRTARHHLLERVLREAVDDGRGDAITPERRGLGHPEHGRGEFGGRLAGAFRGSGAPQRHQVGQGRDVLLRADRAGHLLAEPDDLDAVRAAPVGGVELGEHARHRLVYLRRPTGELRHQRVIDAVELERRRTARAAMTPSELDRQATGDLVGQQVVIEFGDHHDGVVQRPGVHRQPGTAGALDLVSNDEVGVQVRVPRAGVPMVEPGRNEPGDLVLTATGGPSARERGGLLQEGERLPDCGPVRREEGGTRVVVSHRPESRDGLRRGEGQVEPRDSCGRALGELDAGDGRYRGVAGFVGEVGGKGGDLLGDPLRRRGVPRVWAAERSAGPRVLALTVQVRHLLFADVGSLARAAVGEPDEPTPVPAAGRVPRGRVVRRQVRSRGTVTVPRRGAAQQVLVSAARGQAVHRHHHGDAPPTTATPGVREGLPARTRCRVVSTPRCVPAGMPT